MEKLKGFESNWVINLSIKITKTNFVFYYSFWFLNVSLVSWFNPCIYFPLFSWSIQLITKETFEDVLIVLIKFKYFSDNKSHV